jgi:hypothetical protein
LLTRLLDFNAHQNKISCAGNVCPLRRKIPSAAQEIFIGCTAA